MGHFRSDLRDVEFDLFEVFRVQDGPAGPERCCVAVPAAVPIVLPPLPGLGLLPSFTMPQT